MDEDQLKSKWVADLHCYQCLNSTQLLHKDFDYEKVHRSLTSCVKAMHGSRDLLDSLCGLNEKTVRDLSPSETVCFKRLVLVCILSKSLLVYESVVSKKFKINSLVLKQIYQLTNVAWLLNAAEKRNLMRTLVYWNLMLILTSVNDKDLSNETLLSYKHLLNGSQFASLQEKTESDVACPQFSFVRELTSAVLKAASMLASDLEVPFLVKVASTDSFCE